MIIDFNTIAETTVSCMHGGTGEITAKMYTDPHRSVTPCRIHAGGEIGLHTHETADEICYVLYGTGVALCDGAEEPLYTDVCHICPKGASHAIRNTGMTDLVLLSVTIEHKSKEATV